MSVVLAIVMLYLKGDLENVAILGKAQSMEQCKALAPKAIAAGQPHFSKDEQITIKCVELDDVPVAASGFGLATDL